MLIASKVLTGYHLVNPGNISITEIQSVPPGIRIAELPAGEEYTVVSPMRVESFHFFTQAGDVPVEGTVEPR